MPTQTIIFDVSQQLEEIQASRDAVKSTAIALVKVDSTFLPGTTIGATQWVAYAMTKAALNHMTALLAKSHAPVRFNAVAPGLVETPWTADWGPMHEAVSAMAPVPRSATPADCAEATLALIRTRYATGHVFLVDGGLSLVG